LEALCKRLREDARKPREETTLEGMIHSRDELILEMVEEYGLNRMGERNVIAPPAPAPAAMHEEIVEEEAPWRIVHRS
jgi:hypothetical protein